MLRAGVGVCGRLSGRTQGRRHGVPVTASAGANPAPASTGGARLRPTATRRRRSGARADYTGEVWLSPGELVTTTVSAHEPRTPCPRTVMYPLMGV